MFFEGCLRRRRIGSLVNMVRYGVPNPQRLHAIVQWKTQGAHDGRYFVSYCWRSPTAVNPPKEDQLGKETEIRVEIDDLACR